ncbi:MAG: neutral zinc metallopeptidase [Pseudonocardiales bacterium]|nr:neutral zinc metallopeptidase [Pseudonocardiales bacterium]
MNSTANKVVAKVAAVVAVSGSVFVFPATSAITSPISVAALAEPQASPQDCKPHFVTHCYTKTNIQNYIDEVRPRIVEFFQASYHEAVPGPSDYRFIPEGPPMQSACTNKDGSRIYLDAKAYDYCPDDQKVYLGQVSMWDLYYNDGEIAPAVALAHEWGHDIQHRKGVREPKNPDESVRHENQADCVAGAWIAYADQRNWLKSEDVLTINKMLEDMARDEKVDRDHGTLEKRSKAMSLGIRRGLKACNEFDPTTPIIAS